MNSCVGHGEGEGAEHVHAVAEGTKSQSTSTRSGVWRPLDGTLSVGEELTSDHRGASKKAGVWRPLEGLMPVEGELASDFRGASVAVHVEAREGRMSTTQCGTRLVDLGQGCEVEVKIPTGPESDPRLPGPGISLRERWGWKPLLRTLTSGIWVLSGALRSVGLEGVLEAAASWECRSTYRTAWAVCPQVRLPMLVLVWARPSYRATYGQRLFRPPHTCVEGYRTPDVALVY